MTRAAHRVDVLLSGSGMPTLESKLTDPFSAVAELQKHEKKASALLFIVANRKAPWSSVLQIASGAHLAGWDRIALAVESPRKRGHARVLMLHPAPEADQEAAKLLMQVEGGLLAAGLEPGAPRHERWIGRARRWLERQQEEESHGGQGQQEEGAVPLVGTRPDALEIAQRQVVVAATGGVQHQTVEGEEEQHYPP